MYWLWWNVSWKTSEVGFSSDENMMLGDRNPLQNIQAARKQLRPLGHKIPVFNPILSHGRQHWPIPEQVSDQTTTSLRWHGALSNSATGIAPLWMRQIHWRLEPGSPLSRYRNHEANPGIQLPSTFFFFFLRDEGKKPAFVLILFF